MNENQFTCILNLDIYFNKPNSDFTKFIEELLPKNYHEINSHVGRKTSIIDINKYNEFCYNNEKIYIRTLVDDIFPRVITQPNII